MESDAHTQLATAALSLARRFAAGATLWCWSPGAPRHARHVAVEFVHPVVVGARALPAVAVVEDDPAASLRAQARAGDVLLVVAGAGERLAAVAAILRRAEAWGLEAVWLGAGPPPPPSASRPAHLLWVGDDADAWHDGRLALGYHVLWELTHVCFEHPGLLRGTDADPAPVCVTCADDGRLGEVVATAGDDATVRTAGGVEVVSTAVVGPVAPGDLVLVHAGTAITVVEP